MVAFITTNGEVDAGTLKQEFVELLQAAFPGWEPSEGDLLLWLAEGAARISADVFEQMTALEQAAFKRYGEAIAGVPPIQAAPATALSVWTMVDDAGYTVDAGTLVGIPGPENRPVAFETIGDTEIAPGATKATILLSAVEAGRGGNELSGEPVLESALAFVLVPAGIELEAVTAGGVDEEEEVAYLNRLVEALRLLSISLILPEDFEVDARSFADVARAKCVKNYNPEDESTDNPLMQCLFPIDDEGLEVGAPKEAELLASQSARLIGGVIHHVAPPQYTQIKVKASIVIEAGFDPAAIVAAVKVRLEEFLSPAKWGAQTTFGDTGNSAGWINRTTLSQNDLVIAIGRIPGVAAVVKVELAKEGSAFGVATVDLTGVAPLSKPGVLEVSAT